MDCTLCITVSAIVFFYLFFWKFSNRTFPWVMNIIQNYYAYKFIDGTKIKLFDSLKNITSQDAKLKSENSLRILEIGAGTGVNFKYYPKNCRLITVEPNPHFMSYFNNNRNKFDHIILEKHLEAKGEEMTEIESNSIDAVTLTYVLCTATDMEGLFKEVYRVLRPGGKFYFLEHVRDFNENNYINHFFQEFLTTSGIWYLVMDGCHLNRDSDVFMKTLKETGFQTEEVFYEYIKAPIIFKFISCMIRGIAVKP